MLQYGSAWQAAKEAGTEGLLEAPPELLDGFGGWYEDFWELSSERQIGMGVGPIPTSSIEAHVMGWSYVDADMFRGCIRAMDAAYLEQANGDGKPATAQGSAQDAFRGATSGRRGK